MHLSRLTVLVGAAVAAAAIAGTGYALSERGVSTSRPAVTHLQEQEDGIDNGAGALGAGAQSKVDLIAGEFGVSADSVEALHAQGIGFGAIFKLHAIARATGTDVQTLIDAAPVGADGEREFAFGELINAMTPEQHAALDDGPKNFGMLVSAAHRPAHAGPPDHAGSTDNDD
jgi:hypothetical protein